MIAGHDRSTPVNHPMTAPDEHDPRRSRWSKSTRIGPIVAVTLLCVVAAFTLFRTPTRDARHDPGIPRPPAPVLLSHRFMLGDYNSPVYQRRNGKETARIDAAATIAALKAAHVNTYAYLIYPDRSTDPRVSQGQWDQLPAFADLAGQARIDVFVYLVPPTEVAEKVYAPYHWDYSGWAAAIGRMASRHRSIKGIMLDDFGGNTFARKSLGFHFTPVYVAKMVTASRRDAPWLSFVPILYYHDMIGTNAILSGYRTLIDGVVFPYFGLSDGHTVAGNTVDASLSLSQGVDIAGLLKCRSGSACSQVTFPSRSNFSPVKDVATLEATMSPLPGQRRQVQFSLRDDSGLKGGGAYTVKVLVDGQPAGSSRPTGTQWASGSVDVTALTADEKDVTVTLEIVRAHGVSNYSVLVDDVSVTGMQGSDLFSIDHIRGSRGVVASTVHSLPFVYMTYAKPLSAEKGRGASAGYVAQVLSSIGKLKEQKLVDGSLIFNLHLPGSSSVADPDSYAVVQQAYARWDR